MGASKNQRIPLLNPPHDGQLSQRGRVTWCRLVTCPKKASGNNENGVISKNVLEKQDSQMFQDFFGKILQNLCEIPWAQWVTPFQNCQLCGLNCYPIAPCPLLCKRSPIVEAPGEVNRGSGGGSVFFSTKKMEGLKSSKWPNSYGSTHNIPHFSPLCFPWQSERQVNASLPWNKETSVLEEILFSYKY